MHGPPAATPGASRKLVRLLSTGKAIALMSVNPAKDVKNKMIIAFIIVALLSLPSCSTTKIKLRNHHWKIIYVKEDYYILQHAKDCKSHNHELWLKNHHPPQKNKN